MNASDIPFLAEIFFGISLVVFCIVMYVILPSFIYNKRTVFKPKLINAMWIKFFRTPKSKQGVNRSSAKRINRRNSLQVDEPMSYDRNNKH